MSPGGGGSRWWRGTWPGGREWLRARHSPSGSHGNGGARSRLRVTDLLRVGGQGLGVRPGRTTLTALGIAVGIAAIVGVLGISASSRASLLREIDALGSNLLAVQPGDSLLSSEEVRLPDEATAMIRRVPPVEQAAAITTVETSVRRTDLVPEAETSGITVVAAENELLETLRGRVASGRFLDAATVDTPGIVLGSVAAERLGITDLTGSPLLYVEGHWFGVVGILDSLLLAPDLDRNAFVDYGVAAELFGTVPNPSTVYLRAHPDQVEAVRGVLARTANPEKPNEVSVSRPSEALEARAAVDVTLTRLLLGLGAVALVVGGVGIANVMVISVLERRAEIGVRRALGAKRAHIAGQFLTESVALAGLGGIAGLALGAGVTYGYSLRQGWLVDVPVVAYGGGALVAVVIGGLAGLYPAVRAARLDPAEAVHPAA